MKIRCICCAREINLNHEIFENYAGPVKCFGCSTMLELKTEHGNVCSLALLSPQEGELRDKEASPRP
jgi:hypothetical protein